MHSDISGRQAPQIATAEKGLIFRSLAQNRILILIVATYFLAGHFVSAMTAQPMDTVGAVYLFWIMAAIVPVFLLSMLLWRFGHMVLNVRPEKPIRWLLEDLRNNFLHDPERVLNGAIAFFGIVLFAAVFSFLKDSIPLINPFSWDQTFAAWDRALHGGYDPYVLLAPIFANPVMSKVADFSYSVWFFLIYFFSFTACMDKEDAERRNTFLYAFFLTWMIGGTILAIVFSSVGPVYYAEFGFGDQFLPLMQQLQEINAITPLTALELQAALLDGYQNGGPVSGISAMPSMHVALSWILAFQAFQYRKWLGWMVVAFAILIQLSSVHLAWHYAVDGYLGFFIALFCWVLAKWLARLQSGFDKRETV